MTTTKAAPTPGPWTTNVARLSDGTINVAHVIGRDGQSIAQLSTYGDDETCVNANLITEAGAVFHETGLSPRELAARLAKAEQQRDQAVAALWASCGYLMNAAIDLETGAPKKTALRTINGGLEVVRAAIANAEK